MKGLVRIGGTMARCGVLGNRTARCLSAAVVLSLAAAGFVSVSALADNGSGTSPGAARDSTVQAVTRPGPDSLSVYAVEEIQVTASRLPSRGHLYLGNVAVATGADLTEIASSTVGEGLAAEPGVGLIHYGSSGSLQTLSLRGGSSTEVVFLLDGVPISDTQISSLDLNWLPMGGASRVEAMKGGASSLYGSGAVGGAVNVVSMDAMPEVPTSRITWWTGSFGAKAADALLCRSVAARLGVLAAYDYSKSDGWVANSAYRGDKYYGKMAARIGKAARLEAVGFGYNGNIETPGAFPGVQRDHRRFYKLSFLSAGDRGFVATYYRSASDQTYTSGGGTPSFYVYRHEGTLDGLALEVYRRSLDREATSLGAGAERKQIESNAVGNRSASDIYGFFQQEVARGPVRLSGSVRLETHSMFDLEAAYQVTTWFSAGRGIAFFTRLDRSFMYPSFDDLYWKGPAEEGDPNLRTERSRGLDLGARLERGQMEVGLTGYYRDVDDMIIWRTDPTCGWTRSANARALLKGIEVSLEVEPAPGLEVSLSYSLAAARDEAGEQMSYKPSQVLTWKARADHALSKHVSCGLVFSGRDASKVSSGHQYDYAAATCLHDTSLPGYASALLYAYLAVDRARIFARVPNLFNDAMWPTWGKPRLPGRSYEAGVSWELID